MLEHRSVESGRACASGLVSAVTCESYTAEVVSEALRSVLAPLGGLSSFVQPGQTVLLKPNLLCPSLPEKAATTHPSIVAGLALLCRECGASRIWIGDSCAGNHDDVKLWETTGMAAVAESSGAELKSFKGPLISWSCKATSLPVPIWYKEVDVLISIPKLKTHLLTTLTCALKNVYGLVSGNAKALYHAQHPSPASMSEFIVDVHEVLRPDLSIVDAVVAMERDGPSTGNPVHLGLVLAGRDAVSIDAVCAGMLGLRSYDVPTTRIAAERGLGCGMTKNIVILGSGRERLAVSKLKRSRGYFLNRIPESLFQRIGLLTRFRPYIRQEKCISCGICSGICSQQAIARGSAQDPFSIQNDRCILCMCCVESCPQHAIEVSSIWTAIIRLYAMIRQAFSK